MGWYHAINLLAGEIPSGQLTDVVESWFLGGGSEGPGSEAFAAFAAAHPEVRFHTCVADMPKPEAGIKKVALIAGRTADNPRLLEECIAQV